MKKFWEIFGLALSAFLFIMTIIEDCNEVEPPEPIQENGYHQFSQKYGNYTLTRKTDTCGKYPTVNEEITITWKSTSNNIQINYGKLAWECINGSMIYTASDGRTYSKIAEPRKYVNCAAGGKIKKHIQNAINELATWNMNNVDQEPKGKYIYSVSAGNTNRYGPFLEWRSDKAWKGFNYLKWRIDNCKK